MTESPNPGTGRRAGAAPSRRRVDLLIGLTLLAPAVVAVSVAAVGGEDNPLPVPQSPTTSALTSATVVCPEGLTASGSVRVTRTPGVKGGKLTVATAPAVRGSSSTTGKASGVTVAQGSTVEVPASGGATVLDGRGAAAPGIAAGRDDALAVPECRAPSYDEWLVGVGHSARYATTIELVNPDDGGAVVDLALYGADGPVEEPALRGVEVPAHGVRRVALAKVAPRADPTAIHLTVVRGRVTATARTTWDPLGRGRVTTDFLPTVAEPATDGLILGVPDKPAQPTLRLANPGEDEVRVTVRFVTAQAEFTPTGAPAITVSPSSLKSVDLSKLLRGKVAKGVVGLRIEATGPVVSSLTALVKDDLVLLAPSPALRDPAAAVLPAGAKTLVLGGATRTGVVHVTSYDAAGKAIGDEQVEIGADRATTLALSAKAVSVSVEARGTAVRAVVSIPKGGKKAGLAVLRLRPAELKAQIPVVFPE